VKFLAPDLVAAAFKKACAAKGVSMAGALSSFMAEYSDTAVKKSKVYDYGTKRLRRAAVRSIILQIEQIRIAEENYRDNIPENLQGSVVYDNAEQCVSLLEEAAQLLDSF
jgi:hypothetical protein